MAAPQGSGASSAASPSSLPSPPSAPSAPSPSSAPSASRGSRGAFIVLEGLDRSGKSTQCKLLVEFLGRCGVPVVSLRFPDRSTRTGQEIDEYLSSTKHVDSETIHRLFSQNRWEKMEQMRELLLSGTTLVVDRYAFSGAAYSAAKGLDLEWCKLPDAGLLAPDLVLFLDVNPEAAALRGEFGGERYEKLEFQKAVQEQYLRLRDDTWQVVDASAPVEDVASAIQTHVAAVLAMCRGGGKNEKESKRESEYKSESESKSESERESMLPLRILWESHAKEMAD